MQQTPGHCSSARIQVQYHAFPHGVAYCSVLQCNSDAVMSTCGLFLAVRWHLWYFLFCRRFDTATVSMSLLISSGVLRLVTVGERGRGELHAFLSDAVQSQQVIGDAGQRPRREYRLL